MCFRIPFVLLLVWITSARLGCFRAGEKSSRNIVHKGCPVDQGEKLSRGFEACNPRCGELKQRFRFGAMLIRFNDHLLIKIVANHVFYVPSREPSAVFEAITKRGPLLSGRRLGTK